MTFEDFFASITDNAQPSEHLHPVLRALWLDHRGNWEMAHQIAQTLPSTEADWLHAYLHRKEGDHSNAEYWYQRAGRPPFEGSLEEEWEIMARSYLDQ